ncbi:MAG: OsmC family protein [Thermaerobacter sp.]|nr:OsmC family protein [Thermaerobacter sp.]
MAEQNKVDLAALRRFQQAAATDPAQARRTQRLEGAWSFTPGEPQFRAQVGLPGGSVSLEADQPPFLGGSGSRPGPIQYALFGLAACFTATFATLAAEQGIELSRLETAAEMDLDLSRTLGLSQRPIMEEVRLVLQAQGDASPEALAEVLREAEERCPASFCLTHPVRLSARLA